MKNEVVVSVTVRSGFRASLKQMRTKIIFLLAILVSVVGLNDSGAMFAYALSFLRRLG